MQCHNYINPLQYTLYVCNDLCQPRWQFAALTNLVSPYNRATFHRAHRPRFRWGFKILCRSNFNRILGGQQADVTQKLEWAYSQHWTRRNLKQKYKTGNVHVNVTLRRVA